MKNPLVSIIVPVYNVKKYLNRCIESLVNQIYRNIEIIIIDDGSTDGSSEICDYYAKLDDRIKVIHKKNDGLSSARNKGIEVSSGEYIGFIDSDDWIEPEMYSVLVRNILETESDVADVGMKSVINEKPFHNRRETIKIFKDDEILVEYFLFDKSSVCRKLYSREIIGDIRFPEKKTNEDICTNFLFLSRAKKMVVSSLNLYHYYRNPESITGERFRERDFDLLEACDNLYFLAKSNSKLSYYASVKKELARYSLLGRFIAYKNDEIQKLDKRINEVFSQLKENKWLLLKSNISIKRKVLIICICILGPFKMKRIATIIKKEK